MTTEPKKTSEIIPGHWVRILLVASLACNVLFVSMVGGAHMRNDRQETRDPQVDRVALRDSGILPFFDALPPGSRGQVMSALQEEGRGMKPDRAALAADFQTFLSALRADPFDAEALVSVLDVQDDRAQDRVRASREILMEQISGLTVEERVEFANTLERGFRGALRRAPGAPARNREVREGPRDRAGRP